MSHPAFMEQMVPDTPSPYALCVTSLDLQCCDVRQLPLGHLFIVLNVLLSEFGYVVCGGLEKYSKHKINVSKHFSDVEEKYDFYWFLFSLMYPRLASTTVQPSVMEPMISTLLAGWQDYGSAPSLAALLHAGQALYLLSSVTSPTVIARFLFESVLNHLPHSSALEHEQVYHYICASCGPRDQPFQENNPLQSTFCLFLVFLLYL